MAAEARLLAKVERFLTALGPDCYFLKVHGNEYQTRGTPDIIGCYRGQAFGLELKAPGEQPTKIQLYQLRRMENAGAIVTVADSWSVFLHWWREKLDNLPVRTGQSGP